MQKIIFYTDGSCKKENVGGFGVVAFEGEKLLTVKKERAKDTTNNREELKAIISALEFINLYKDSYFKNKEIIIYSDSSYCINAINDWIPNLWSKNNWKNSQKKEVKNKDLIMTLYKYINKNFIKNQVKFKHIKGHNGDLGNEIADALATADKEKFSLLIRNNKINLNYILNIKF